MTTTSQSTPDSATVPSDEDLFERIATIQQTLLDLDLDHEPFTGRYPTARSAAWCQRRAQAERDLLTVYETAIGRRPSRDNIHLGDVYTLAGHLAHQVVSRQRSIVERAETRAAAAVLTERREQRSPAGSRGGCVMVRRYVDTPVERPAAYPPVRVVGTEGSES